MLLLHMVLFIISCVVKKLPQKFVKIDELVSDHYLLLDKEHVSPCINVSGINGTLDIALFW